MNTTRERYLEWKRKKEGLPAVEPEKAKSAVPSAAQKTESIEKPSVVQKYEKWQEEKATPKSVPISDTTTIERTQIRNIPFPTEIWDERYSTPQRKAAAGGIAQHAGRTSDDIISDYLNTIDAIPRSLMTPGRGALSTIGKAADAYEAFKRIVELADEYKNLPDDQKKPLWGDVSLGDIARSFIEGGYNQFMHGASGLIGSVDEFLTGLLPKGIRNALGIPDDYVSPASEEAEYFRQTLENLYSETTEGAGVLGKKAVELAQNAGNMVVSLGVGTVATGGMTAPSGTLAGKLIDNAGLLALSASAAGSGAQEAKAKGATAGQALAYGALAGATEAVTEKLFGGNPLFDNSAGLVNRLISKLTKNTKLLNFLASRPVEILNEGLEEMIAEIMGPVYERLTFDPNADFATLEQIIEAGIDGVLLSGIMQAGSEVLSVPSRISQAQQIRAAQKEAQRQSQKETQRSVITDIPEIRTADEILAELGIGSETTFASPQLAQDERISQPNEINRTTIQAQTSEQSAPQADTLQSLISNLGDKGAKAFYDAFKDANTDYEKYNAFVRYYESGAAGLEYPVAERANSYYGKIIDEQTKLNAFEAGRSDREATLQAEKERAQYATFQGTESGLILDDTARKVPEKTRSILNDLAKAAGVKVVVKESIAGGKANGLYNNGVIEIAMDAQNPTLVVATHEVTHRLQEVAPEEYRAFRDYAVQVLTEKTAGNATLVEQYRIKYAEGGVNITSEQAMDEIAADFAGELFGNEETLKRFIRENDRNIVQRFFDAVREFIQKIKDKFKNRSQQDAALREFGLTMSQLEKAERLYRDTFEVAQNTAKGKSQATEKIRDVKSDAKYSLKDSEGRALTLAQAEYFKDSKVRDKDGNLLVVYHGTKAKFTVFDINRSGQNWGGDSKYGRGIYFAGGKEGAIEWSHSNNVIEAYLNITNPLYVDEKTPENLTQELPAEGFSREWAMENGGNFIAELKLQGKDVPSVLMSYGYDGIIDEAKRRPLRGLEEKDMYQYVVFSPEQIKSVNNLNPTDDPDIRYSLKDTSAIEETAKNYFGTTANWNEAGYITTDGTLLDFSGRKQGAPGGYRTMDHREIQEIFDEVGETEGIESRTDAMIHFMAGGNIRLMPEMAGINLSVRPTKAQERALTRYINKFRGEVILDIDNTNGDTLVSVEYPEGTSSLRILNDIRTYFDEGIEPSAPELAKYRYSLKGTTDIAKAYAELSEQNKTLQAELNKTIRENKQLRERVEDLKAQTKLTEGYKTDPKAAKKIAKEIVEDYMLTMDVDDITKELIDIYDFIGNGVDDYGNELTWEVLKDKTLSLAKAIVESAEVLNTETLEEYNELKKYLRNTDIYLAEQYRGNFPDSYNEFRKRNFGRIRLVNEGLPVDEMYQELSETFPAYFDAEIQVDPVDQLLRIEEALNALKPVYENPYGGRIDEAAEYLANEIIARYYDTPAVETFADKQDKKLRLEKAKRYLQKEKLREDMQERIEKIKAENRARVQRILERERKRRADREQKIKERFVAKEEKLKARQQKREMRAKIRRHMKDLGAILIKPTDTRHVPASLELPVAAFLNGVNVSHVDNVVIKTIDDLDDMDRAYKELQKAESTAEYIDLDPDFFDNVDILKQARGKKLGDFTAEELEALYRVVVAVKHSVTTFNKTLSGEKRQLIEVLGTNVINELRTNKGYVEHDKFIQMFADLLNMNMLDSFSFFEELGPTMNSLFKEIRNGLDKKIRNTKIAEEYMQNLIGDTDITQWTDKKAKATTFKLSTGDSITLTPAQVMSLYLLHRQPQARDHIYIGGIKQAPTVTKGKYGYKISKSYKPAKVIYKDVQDIINTLTPEQKRIAEGIGKFFTEVTAQWGNEVSMKLYGYEKFTEENYFPIVSDKNYLNVAFGETTDATLKNMGITKSRIKGANNPVIIEDVFDVYTRQADQMGSYNAFVLPLSDIQKVYNFRNPKGSGSVKEAIERKFGARALRYFRDLMIDINGGIRVDVGGEIPRWLISRYKSAAMGWNLGVVLQQPTSYLRAGALIDSKYLAKALVKKGDWEKVKKYAPIAQWKDWGYFTLDVGRQLKNVFLGKEVFVDKTMALISEADNFTWTRLWNAVELETKDRHPSVKHGTEEFYEICAERFSEIIDRTQVVDTVLHRTAIHRSKSDLTKMATSFMSEPMKQYNLLRTAFRNAMVQKTKAAKQRAIQATSATLASFMLNQIVRTLVEIYRKPDDKEDRDFLTRFLQMYIENAALDALGVLPYLRDIVNIFQGYDVERMDMEGISDFINAVKKPFKKDKDGNYTYTPYDTIKSIVNAAAQLTGIPVKNLLRTIETTAIRALRWTNAFELEFTVAKVMYDVDNNSQVGKFYDILYRAKKAGDKEAYERIFLNMRRMGVKVTSMQNAIGDRYKGDPYDGMVEAVKNRDRTAFELAAASKFTSTGGDELSESDYAKYLFEREKLAYSVVSDLVSDMDFWKLDDTIMDKSKRTERDKAIKKALDYASDVVESKYHGGDKLEGWVKTANELSNMVDVSDYILFSMAMNAASKEDKKIDSEEVQRILDNMTLTPKERELLFGTRYKVFTMPLDENPYE